jgi:pimeloyl-ACP methyl ester carboxylesterase
LTLFYSPGWMLTHMNELAAMAPAAEPIPAYAQELHRRASAEHDSWDRLPDISTPTPTLVIHGSQDQVIPTANAPLLAGRIPGAELHIVPRGRHIFYLEFRAEVNRVVMDFLTRHPLTA